MGLTPFLKPIVRLDDSQRFSSLRMKILLFDEFVELVLWQRMAVKVALHKVTAVLSQKISLLT